MTYIRISPAQAAAIRGKYGNYHALDPVPLDGTTDYILTDAVLSEPAFAGVKATLQAMPTYPQWTSGVAYQLDNIVEHGGRLWRIVQAHTSQANWTPDATPALWRTAHRRGEIPPWVQPLGQHDAYQLGDRVTHGGKVWTSTAANNVWVPGQYGWQQDG